MDIAGAIMTHHPTGLKAVVAVVFVCLSITVPAASVSLATGTAHVESGYDGAERGGHDEVEVTGNDGARPGVVVGSPLPGHSEPDARSISYGATVTSVVDLEDPMMLESPAPNDDRAGTRHYEPLTFEGTAGEVVDANLSAPGAGTVLALRNPDGETIAVSANGAGDGPTRLVARLTTDGEYTFRVLGNNPMMTFRYSLSLSRVDHYDPNPESIDVGETVFGEISDDDRAAEQFNGPHDNITLSVRRGQRIRVRLDSPTAPDLRLYSPNGTLLTLSDWTEGKPADFTTELPYGGDYRLTVSGFGRSPPIAYRLSVSPARVETPPVPEERREDREYAEFEVRRAVLNTTTRYAGSPFELRAQIRNTGTVWGNFDASILAGRTQLGHIDEGIDFSRSEEVVASARISRPGTYPVFIGAEYVGQVRVLPRPEPTLSVSTRNELTRAIMNYSRANSTFDIPLAAASGTDRDFDRLHVRFGRDTRQLTILARERTIRSGQVALEEQYGSLPRGADPVRLLRLTRRFPGQDDGVVNADLSFRIAANALDHGVSDAVLYQARDGGTGWLAVDPTLVSATESTYRFRAPVTDSNTVILAERTPVFHVTNVSAETQTAQSGTQITVTAEVMNRGLAVGTEEVLLRLGEQTVTTRTVTLVPNETATIRFERTVNESGRHRARVGNQTVDFEVLAVSQQPTTTPTPTPTAAPTKTAAPVAERTVTALPSPTPDAVDDALAPILDISVPLLLLLGLSLVGGLALVVIGITGEGQAEEQLESGRNERE